MAGCELRLLVDVTTGTSLLLSFEDQQLFTMSFNSTKILAFSEWKATEIHHHIRLTRRLYHPAYRARVSNILSSRPLMRRLRSADMLGVTHCIVSFSDQNLHDVYDGVEQSRPNAEIPGNGQAGVA